VRGQRLRELFSIDLRSLAAFRVALAFLILVDLATRARFLALLYTDQGLIPRSSIASGIAKSPLAIHFLAGSVSWEVFLFALTGAFALALLLGFQTRMATIGLWMLMLSLVQRNPLVANAADSVMVLLLFWSMFLPLGSRASLDAPAGADREGRVLSAASAALLLQPAMLYLFAGFVKVSPPWVEGSAVGYALGQSYWVRPVGEWLREQTLLSQALTQGTRVLEVFGPFLLFSPFATNTFRAAGIFAFVGFNLGLFLCIQLGLFPFYSTVALIAFVPGVFWDRVLPLLGRWFPSSSSASGAGSGEPDESPAIIARGRYARLADVTVIAALTVGLLTALSFHARRSLLPFPADEITAMLSLRQNWEMYGGVAPRDFRMRTTGLLRNGSTIDYQTNAEAETWPRLYDLLHHYRGRLYFERAWNGPELEHFARWTCREWNAEQRPGRRLVGLHFEVEKTPLGEGGKRERPEYETIVRYRCESPKTDLG
jgi:hypothetical protein